MDCLKLQNPTIARHNCQVAEEQQIFNNKFAKHDKPVVFLLFLAMNWREFLDQRHLFNAQGGVHDLQPQSLNRKTSGYNTFKSISQPMEQKAKQTSSLNIEDMECEGSDGSRNIGCWSIHQNLLYSIFVDQNKLVMISKKKRKKLRIFDRMALFIGSRNSLQCRSHHQKLIQKLGEIKQIVNAFKNYFGKECYRQNYKLMTSKKGRPETDFPILLIKRQQECSEDGGIFSQCEQERNSKSEQVQPDGGVKVEPAEEEDGAERGEVVEAVCKAQQHIQYYAPYGYYISNNLLPYQFFTPFYTLQDAK